MEPVEDGMAGFEDSLVLLCDAPSLLQSVIGST